ncbi:hypothetical protein B0H67DRAFT_592897 [Lasiosphaeris hirsuta]|uniref:Secreted protein n=1 Tax=Lasiosphaeris hirsuta TaxID=260670 RepID=A0AA39ZWP7_9PEZI|nr:hypothetical protein B0H67DRAFT_592897 [Lasiosphaeris hirsuta]
MVILPSLVVPIAALAHIATKGQKSICYGPRAPIHHGPQSPGAPESRPRDARWQKNSTHYRRALVLGGTVIRSHEAPAASCRSNWPRHGPECLGLGRRRW